jgi:ribosome biogenesis GTPase
LPELAIKVGEISQSGEGKHTTTTADLYPVADNAYVIDSPGVRDFILSDLDADVIRNGYREFAHYAHSCRFNNCTHTHEPACQVKQAAEESLIPIVRYRRYLAKLTLLMESEF